MTKRFQNRTEAGRLLSKKLEEYRNKDVVVYALPRGGVEVGVEVARHLNAPLDLLVPRKIGHPDNPEYAVCALAEDGYLVCNQDELEQVESANAGWLREAVEREVVEARRRRRLYLKGRPPLPVQGKTGIITDDGVATGLTVLAAIHEIRRFEPAKVVVAVPVLPRDTKDILEEQADELVALEIPRVYMGAVGAYYREFDQIEDDEVVHLMEKFGTA